MFNLFKFYFLLIACLDITNTVKIFYVITWTSDKIQHVVEDISVITIVIHYQDIVWFSQVWWILLWGDISYLFKHLFSQMLFFIVENFYLWDELYGGRIFFPDVTLISIIIAIYIYTVSLLFALFCTYKYSLLFIYPIMSRWCLLMVFMINWCYQ